MVRVARPGGRILVWDHNPRNPYWGRLMARVPQDTGEERLIPERSHTHPELLQRGGQSQTSDSVPARERPAECAPDTVALGVDPPQPFFLAGARVELVLGPLRELEHVLEMAAA